MSHARFQTECEDTHYDHRKKKEDGQEIGDLVCKRQKNLATSIEKALAGWVTPLPAH